MSKSKEGTENALRSCTCYHVADIASSTSFRESPKKTDMWLEESSFIHLMTPPESQPLTQSRQGHHCHQQHDGYINQHSHLLQLMEASSPSSLVSLCSDCTDRVGAALEEDTKRIYAECHAYQESICDARQRAKTFDAVSKVGLSTTTKAYMPCPLISCG